jgi:hypothetical protein
MSAHPQPPGNTEQSGAPGPSELDALRQTLSALEKSIESKRVALTAHVAAAERLDREWEEMQRAHRENRLQLEATGSMTRQVLEGLTHDVDILKHAFQRWMFRFDRKF